MSSKEKTEKRFVRLLRTFTILYYTFLINIVDVFRIKNMKKNLRSIITTVLALVGFIVLFYYLSIIFPQSLLISGLSSAQATIEAIIGIIFVLSFIVFHDDFIGSCSNADRTLVHVIQDPRCFEFGFLIRRTLKEFIYGSVFITLFLITYGFSLNVIGNMFLIWMIIYIFYRSINLLGGVISRLLLKKEGKLSKIFLSTIRLLCFGIIIVFLIEFVTKISLFLGNFWPHKLIISNVTQILSGGSLSAFNLLYLLAIPSIFFLCFLVLFRRREIKLNLEELPIIPHFVTSRSIFLIKLFNKTDQELADKEMRLLLARSAATSRGSLDIIIYWILILFIDVVLITMGPIGLLTAFLLSITFLPSFFCISSFTREKEELFRLRLSVEPEEKFIKIKFYSGLLLGIFLSVVQAIILFITIAIISPDQLALGGLITVITYCGFVPFLCCISMRIGISNWYLKLHRMHMSTQLSPILSVLGVVPVLLLASKILFVADPWNYIFLGLIVIACIIVAVILYRDVVRVARTVEIK
ncbi:MAG: hypothetical protein ACTSQI_17870 [Candidatus Helarchaeota archaeon]